jgi:glycine/D-amino acid oxidase-like deaminating enzyme
VELIGADALARRLRIAGGRGALVMHGVARVQPARLARGLADAAERCDVTIYENTRALDIAPGLVTTDRGRVHAGTVIRATEGFTAQLPGLEREWLPLNSALIATAPLSPDQWRAIGWDGYEIVGDYAHAYCYAQRTEDGRIAFGGRGIPYRFGSALDTDGQTQPGTIRILHRTLTRLFPTLANVPIDHAWCGTLGVPRDWCASVGLDPTTRIGWAGGYVGLGVSTSNVAGRTLADLVLGRDTPLTALPWVNHRVRRWEVEPLRWGAVNALYGLYRLADRIEMRTGRTSVLARIGDRIAGH